MKSLDFFINEPYLMDGVSGVGGGSATATQTTQTDDHKRLAEAARQATENADKATDGVSSDSSAPADAKAMGADTNLPGTKLNTSDPANATSSSDSTTGNKTEDFTGAQKAPGGLETPLSGGFKMNPATGSISKDGNIIDPKSEAYKGLPDDVKAAVAANTLRLQASQERSSTDKSSTDQAVRNEEAKADAVTQPNGSPEGGNASTGGEKDSTTNAKDAAKTDDAKAKLNPEQESILADLNNYNKDTFGVNDPAKPALKVGDDGKPGYCTDLTCGKTNEIKDDKGNITGYSFDKIKSKNGTEHTLKDISTVDLKAANDRYKSDQAAKLAEPKGDVSKSTNDTPMSQPTLPEAIGAKGIETDKVKILNLNDSTNRDSGEAKNHLLDGQLNSTKNTFGTFKEGDKSYMGFYSEGFGKGDERSGVVEIDANGKPKTEGNLGAGEGWKPASAEQKAMLAKAHDARASELKKLGNGDVNAGLAKLNQIQELQGRIDNLQTWAHSEANKSGANAGGIDTTKMNSLNSAMDLLNKGDLEGAKNEFGKLKSDEIAKYELGQKLTELKGQGFSDAEISKLKESNSTIADINKAIDAKRDKAHALSEADKTKFADTIKDLESRATTEQKVILDKLKGMAGKDGLDKMGKYLQTELKNLAAKVAPKPEPKKKDETRGDGDTIDFTKDAGAKAFKEDFIKSFGEGKQADGEKAFNDLFGKAESNPALKGVIEDFKSLTALDKDGKLKAGLLDALKAGDLEKIKGLQGEITKKSDEASKELADVTAKLTGANKTASEANDAAKKALEANKDEAKKAELEKAATEAKAAFDKSTKELTKLAELKKGLEPLKNLTSKYGKTEDGKLGITGADGKVTALKQDKVEVTPQDIAKNNEELKAKIANGTAKAEEVQKYLADNKIQLTYHTAAGAKNTDGSAVCTPCENNIGVAEKLAQLAGANFNKIPYDSLSKSGAVPRLEITRPGKQNQVIEGTQGTINDYLSKLI